jgi:hypothetical protein
VTLPLPTTVKDPRTQQVLDFIAEQFPIQGGSIAGILGVVPTGTHRTNFSTGEVEFPGANVASTALTINHGLGKEPKSIEATGASFGGMYPETAEWTASTFKLRMVATAGTPGAGTKAKFSWVAFV